MAKYSTRFSVLLPLRAPCDVGPALVLYLRFAEELEREEAAPIGFVASAYSENPAAIWLFSEAYGNPEHLIAFVRRCGVAFRLNGRWGFCWSLSCSSACLDGFGGGAYVLDLATGDTIDWMESERWLASYMEASTSQEGACEAIYASGPSLATIQIGLE